MKENLKQNFLISKAQFAQIEEAKDHSPMLRVIPSRSHEGFLVGYRVSGICRDSLPHQLGLKNGDLILAVNSKPCTSVSEMMERYEEIMGATEFSLLIRRRGNHQILKYSVEK